MTTAPTTTTIGDAALRRALALPDLTDPAHGTHAMQLVVAAATDALARRWRCPVVEYRGSPIVSLVDNYEALGYAPDAPAREARYTRYVGDGVLLRTHTSAMIPQALRRLAASPPADVLLVCPGLVYRRDVVDRLHVGEPHQLDLWRIRAGELGEPALDEMVEAVVGAVVPGAEYRTLPASHPYTERGREVEVRVGGGWVELLECGLAAPHVLGGAGLDPVRYRGLALGMGLERAVMLRKGVDDIRLLRSADARVARQMGDLAPYRPVSAMPPIRRDLSIAVGNDVTAEELGDRVRSLAPELVDAVEEVAVLAETPRGDLPPQAIARIGVGEGQKNVLLRLVLRHPTRTLTDAEANALRDAVYAAVHEGSAHEWAAPPPEGRSRAG